jgi:HAD superfamily hydrolase (TIGR01490 family)
VWGVFSQILFMRFGANDEKLTKIRESVLKVTKGWDRQEVRTLVAETINEIIEPLIYSEALELIDHHLAQGDEVWLVSMAPSEIVEPFAELLGITGAIASRAKIDEEGKFTGEMEFFAQGENKAVAMRELAQQRCIDLSESYSDSETDIPMLEAVGHAYAVNPDRTLTKLAHENEWPILGFSHPVRAHDRSRSHTPFLISALVIGVAAVLGRTQLHRH